jgi:hypothetical protein
VCSNSSRDGSRIGGGRTQRAKMRREDVRPSAMRDHFSPSSTTASGVFM